MIVVVGRLRTDAAKREELVRIGQAVASRAEAGCISYRRYEDTDLENEFVFVEEWESTEALQQRFATCDRLLSGHVPLGRADFPSSSRAPATDGLGKGYRLGVLYSNSPRCRQASHVKRNTGSEASEPTSAGDPSRIPDFIRSRVPASSGHGRLNSTKRAHAVGSPMPPPETATRSKTHGAIGGRSEERYAAAIADE